MAGAEHERAVAAVDRELAANLELATMFDQTHQPVVLENGEFALARDALAASLRPVDYQLVSKVYDDIVAVEAAMERRGPAGTFKDADRLIVEAWEGDAREAQRVLRASLLPPPPAGPPAAATRGLLARLRGAVRRPRT